MWKAVSLTLTCFVYVLPCPIISLEKLGLQNEAR
jgi:hypothetical protein